MSDGVMVQECEECHEPPAKLRRWWPDQQAMLCYDCWQDVQRINQTPSRRDQ